MKHQITINNQKEITIDLPEEFYLSDTDGYPFRWERYVEFNGEFYILKSIKNNGFGYELSESPITPQEVYESMQSALNDGYCLDSNKEEFEEALDKARYFVNNQF